jgi:hypothetical protein
MTSEEEEPALAHVVVDEELRPPVAEVSLPLAVIIDLDAVLGLAGATLPQRGASSGRSGSDGDDGGRVCKGLQGFPIAAPLRAAGPPLPRGTFASDGGIARRRHGQTGLQGEARGGGRSRVPPQPRALPAFKGKR